MNTLPCKHGYHGDCQHCYAERPCEHDLFRSATTVSIYVDEETGHNRLSCSTCRRVLNIPFGRTPKQVLG